MESIEKLREWAQKYGPMGSHDPLMFADEIEREIAERYVLLPVDANGEQWGEADRAFYANGENFARRLAGFSYACEEGRWLLEDGDGCTFYADECRHVKPRTIEDVLRDFLNESFKWNAVTGKYEVGNEYNEKKLRRYADVLRDLLGGDAE